MPNEDHEIDRKWWSHMKRSDAFQNLFAQFMRRNRPSLNRLEAILDLQIRITSLKCTL